MDLKQEPADEELVYPQKLFESVWFEAETETVVVTPDHANLCDNYAKPSEEHNPLQTKKKPSLKTRRCTQCDFTTVHGNSLKYHMLTHTDERPYPCEYCDFTSKYPPILRRHINTQHADLVITNMEPELFTCAKCDYKTSVKQNLKGHVRKHKKDKQFKCSECSFETAYRHNYAKHAKSHEVGEYKCDKCTFVTKYHGHITRHMEQIHNEVMEGSKHVCEFCQTTSKEKWKLRKHKERSIMAHTIKCEICEFETMYRCQMRKHKRTHLDEKGDSSFVIAAANAVTIQQKVVGQDILEEADRGKQTVNIPKEGICEYNETTYKCDKCIFETKFHGHIIRHLQNIHDEVLESSHVCEFCMLSRVDATKLKQHKERSHVKEALKCVQCDFTTHYKCEMKRHKDIQHTVLAEESNVSSVEPSAATSHMAQKVTEKPANTAVNVQSQSYERQANVNVEDGVLACDKCPYKTLYEADMSKHAMDVHDVCKYCNNSFGDKWTLNMHMLKSKSEYICKCTYCDFGSYYRCEMRTHTDSHFTELCGPPKDTGGNFDVRNLLTYSHYSQDAGLMKTNIEPQREQPPYYGDLDNPVASSSRVNESMESVNQIGQSKFGQYLIDQNCVDWRSIQVIECSDSVNRYKCPLCDFPSKFKACVQRHFQRHHTGEQNRPYRCVNCDFATKTKDAIALHNKRNPPNQTLKCAICNYTTNYKCAFTAHQKQHYLQKCSMCNAIYKHRHELVKHIATKHLGKGLRCFYCDYVSLRKDSMASHVLTHTGERPFKCNICSFGTVRRSLLDVHMQKRHRIFRRDVGVTYINKSKIESLKVPSTEVPVESTPEPEKTKKPTPNNDDSIHQVPVPYEFHTEIEENEFQSEIHDYSDSVDMLEQDVKPDIVQHFVDVKPSSSMTHVPTEFLQMSTQDCDNENSSEDESFNILACDHCDYTTPIKSKLAAHIMRAHDSKKQYKCMLCPYRTAQSKYLAKHKELHKKTSSIYKCNLCAYKTKFKTFIMKHLDMIHNKTVKTKHLCVYCNTSTVNQHKLVAHHNRNRCKKSIKCTMCNFETIYKCQMKKHKRLHLGELRDEKDETLTNPNAKTDMYTREKITKKIKSEENSDESDSSSDDNTFKCEKCEYKTPNEKKMSKHFVEVHNGCQYCGCGFSTKAEFIHHIQNSKSKDIIKCFFCDFDSDYKCETCKHMCTHFTAVYGIGEDSGVSLETKLTSFMDSFKDETQNKTSQNLQEDKDDKDVSENTDYLQIHENKFGNYLIDPNCVDFRTLKIKRTDRDSPFQCPVCEFSTKYRGSIQRHIQRYHSSNKHRPYKCVDCGFASKSKDSIRLHNRRKISRKVLTCSQCKFTAKVKCVLALHQKVHYSLKCVACTQSFSYKRALVTHFASMHLKIGLKCKFCEFITTAKDAIMEHESTHTGVKPFQCSVCNYASCRKRCLENHFRKYHSFNKKRPLKQENCAVDIKTEKNSQGKLECDLCGFSDTDKSRLSAHIKRKHTLKFMCEKCPYTTPYKGALKTHSLTHQNHSVYKCKRCPYETTFKGRIIIHLEKLHNKTQDKDAKLICELCDEKQRSYYMLRVHQENGKLDKPAICTLCGYETLHKCHMDKHEKSHFLGDNEVESHDIMYTVEKVTDNALKCRFCNFIATKKSSITKHEASHSGANLFKCNLCGHSAKTKILLMIHWKKFHKQESTN